MHHDFAVTGKCELDPGDSPERVNALHWMNARTFAQMAGDEMTRCEAEGNADGAMHWSTEFHKRLLLRSEAFNIFLNTP